MHRKPRTRWLHAWKSAVHRTQSHGWSQHCRPQMDPREVWDQRCTRGRAREGHGTGPQKRARGCWRARLSRKDLCCSKSEIRAWSGTGTGVWSGTRATQIYMILDLQDCKIMLQCRRRIFNNSIFSVYLRGTEWKHWFRTAVFQTISLLSHIWFLCSLSVQHLVVFEGLKCTRVSLSYKTEM